METTGPQTKGNGNHGGREANFDTEWKKCPACGQLKRRDKDFYGSPAAKRSSGNSYCKVCDKLYRRGWKLGLSIQEVLELMKPMRCGLCGKEFTKIDNAIHIHHDHSTGKVKGILCANCNTGLGKFHDDAGFLMKAVAYLKGE